MKITIGKKRLREYNFLERLLILICIPFLGIGGLIVAILAIVLGLILYLIIFLAVFILLFIGLFIPRLIDND